MFYKKRVLHEITLINKIIKEFFQGQRSKRRIEFAFIYILRHRNIPTSINF